MIDDVTVCFIATVFVFVFVIVAAFVIYVILPLKEERDYIKMEISRSDEEDERKAWERELEEFYINRIPVVRRLYYRFKK